MKAAYQIFQDTLQEIKNDGTYKNERVIVTPQKGHIDTDKVKNVINMCSNNYLGLADNKEIIEAAKSSYDQWGYGLSSVRFICGTQKIHKDLEKSIAEFLHMDDTILYSSCFDANGGLFETLLTDQDAIISDSLNHASIIDGVRLCKAKKFRYNNNDMADLERCLQEAQGMRIRLIATDGVFSMDGIIADLKSICDLADKYDALVMVDDSHAVGFMGDAGAGTPEYCGVSDRVDIITGTLGKALGGASGGYTSAKQEIIDLLRQKSRPYLFSNTLAPAITCGAIKTLELLKEKGEHREKLHKNTAYFREEMKKMGFDIVESTHPIVAVMFYDAVTAARAAERMLELGVYVVGFSYPVVPKGKARIRTQVSAAHSKEDLDFVLECFKRVKEEMGI
ncbi:glycine C-acetyltransferase [Robinsoniella peoriensis]|uniref:glycine C-acetyltransferase n=1 Tax=Robinsoniella peoriensis TaxID=180332 RepID=UPI0005C7D156|nr:glycine C-acetyltransferase [Robinsoniella peoriensis]